ncbi:AraC family transcriptional regulator [Mycobacterium sp. CBMA 623]|nr:AraC family transcriptional regulator [Mycobacteroides sp. CBMA 326]
MWGSVPLSGFQFTFVRESIPDLTEWRYHEPHHVIAVYEGGQMCKKEVEFDSGPFQRKLPKTADVMVIPAGRRMAFCAQGDRAEFCELIVDPKLFDQRELQPLLGARDLLLYQLVKRVHSVVDRHDVMARLLRDSLVDVVRLHLIDHYAKIRRQSALHRGLGPALQAKLVEYIDDGLDSDISLATLARYAEMSISEFRTAFVHAFHKTPYQFVLDRRMSRAKHLLAAGQLSITDISAALGFSSPSHFATTFKARAGVTPTVFRDGF